MSDVTWLRAEAAEHRREAGNLWRAFADGGRWDYPAEIGINDGDLWWGAWMSEARACEKATEHNALANALDRAASALEREERAKGAERLDCWFREHGDLNDGTTLHRRLFECRTYTKTAESREEPRDEVALSLIRTALDLLEEP